MNYFEIEWYPTKDAKYGEPLSRKNKVILSRTTGETSIDAKKALNIFCSNFGNLKTNTIVAIREFNEEGIQVGEDIKPTEDLVVPIKK
jgi:glucokinase